MPLSKFDLRRLLTVHPRRSTKSYAQIAEIQSVEPRLLLTTYLDQLDIYPHEDNDATNAPNNLKTTIYGVVWDDDLNYTGLTLEFTGDPNAVMAKRGISVDPDTGEFTFDVNGVLTGIGNAVLRDADDNIVETWQFDMGAM